MIRTRLEGLRTVLCIGAHSDDIEIGCGGTVLKLLSEYPSLSVCWIVLSGDNERAAEARRSADIFLQGAAEKRIEIKEFRDGFFPYDGPEIKEYFHALSREAAPDLILTHHHDDLHQDHRLAAELTWNAFRDHLIWEYEIPKYDGDLGRPNTFVAL
ncbi:MAG: PIG-L family deacetylase, partial [Planctomycetes bacterium]|nr:PIG-L family deacetylase [Planctomycetota bacterium]